MKFNIFICLVATVIGIAAGGVWKSPLMLSPFLERDRIEEAKKLALNQPLEGYVESYSGMFDVNNQSGGKMFFWFFPSERDPKRDSFIIWLNSLPLPSVYGVFMLNGPYTFDGKKIGRRPTSWQKCHNVLYIDSPIGVGFSQPDSGTGNYGFGLDEVGPNLLSVVMQFFKMFPVYRENDLFLAGESYAAKFLALLAKEMGESPAPFNLKGMFLSNPVIDPEVQIDHADFLFQWGLIDRNDFQAFRDREIVVQEALANQDFTGVFKAYNNFIISMTGDDTLLTNMSGPIDPLSLTCNANDMHYVKLFSKPWVRNALHVGNAPFENDIFTNDDLVDAMLPAFSMSVKEIVETLLSRIRIMMFVGQAEILASYVSVMDMALRLHWDGEEEFNNTKRTPILIQDRVVGFKRSYNNLSVIMLRNAGHHVIADQPQITLDLLNEFTSRSRKKH